MIPDFIDKSLIPHKPGIYIYRDEQDEILYVGKAVDLFSRVSSYFRGYEESRSSSEARGSYFSGAVNSFKTLQLVERINSVETVLVHSELEALILEANLIKKYLPPYNIMLKDDKDYIYIGITDENFPKVITARKQDLKRLKKYFGPFPSATTVKKTLKQLRRVFPWCSNPPGSRNKSNRPCFYFHIKLCPGACIGVIDMEDYNRVINMFIKFMEGNHQELLKELSKEMNTLSSQLNFEEAERTKKVFNGIHYLLQPTSISQYLENPNFLEDQNKQALIELQKILNLPHYPERIECYDISNLQGKDATGSMVVLTNGEIDKSQYRRFKIKIAGKPNDYAMHAEMMRRRLKNDWQLPQVIFIDGGRGQVRASWAELQKFAEDQRSKDQSVIARSVSDEEISGTKTKQSLPSDENEIATLPSVARNDVSRIPIFGIAKREEWLYPPEEEVIKLPKRNLALRLIQKIRNESHRFAINYHRKLRARSFGV